MDKQFPKATFRRKNTYTCPICSEKVLVEELFTGRGRLISGDYTIELRRTYHPSKKYGTLNPLLYPVVVCPNCLFSAYLDDFPKPIKDEEVRNLLKKSITNKDDIANLFGGIPDFAENRTLVHGVLSYLFADVTYNLLDPDYIPTFKRALSMIRAAWLLNDCIKEDDNPIFYEVKDLCYKQAAKLYYRVLGFEEKGIEDLSKVSNFGPDIDKNFGFEGIKYIYSLLNYRLCFFESDIHKRLHKFKQAKSLLARLFGLGISSKSKPSIILLLSKYLYKRIGEKIKDYEHNIDNDIQIKEDYIEIELFDLDKEESILKRL